MDTPPSQTQTAPRFGGVVGAVLLMAVLFALVLGVYGAVYMDAFRTAPTQPSVPSLAVAPPRAETSTVAQAVPRPIAIPPLKSLAELNPAEGPAPIEAGKPSYWVEYGAYDGPFYATRLVKRLAAVGITAGIRRVPGIGQRFYYSVRSTTVTDHATAEYNFKLASARIGIIPLLHRGDSAGLANANGAGPSPTERAERESAGYWVQFGAYDAPTYAMELRNRLARAGFVVTIIEQHIPGQARYLVRSAATPLARDHARRLAARAESIVGVTPLVGCASRRLHPTI